MSCSNIFFPFDQLAGSKSSHNKILLKENNPSTISFGKISQRFSFSTALETALKYSSTFKRYHRPEYPENRWYLFA